jgi:uncharacterized membrane protein YsdA (DUF1294 family)
MDLRYYLIWLAIISLVTFILYGFDKARAKSNGWRVPEIVLHISALTGGFPGGWAGRSLFRHKTRKGTFTFVLILSTLLHMGLVYWYL